METTLTPPPSGTKPSAGATPPAATPHAPGTAPPPGPPTSNGDDNKSLHEKSRGKIPWSPEVWKRIDEAVQHEAKRTRIGARFLPIRAVPPKTTSVPSDAYKLGQPPGGGSPVLSVDEGATLRLNEYYVEFELTPQQVDQEMGDIKQLGHSTAVTLATKAANTLALAEDLIIFQGQNAINTANPFIQGLVLTLTQVTLADTGLLNFPIVPAADPPGVPAPGNNGPLSPQVQVIQVAPLAPVVPGVIYGPNTFQAVSQAYSQLQASGHYGPYALVLHTTPYADTFAPLPATLTLTADRIKPLVTAGFFGTGTLPPNPGAGPLAVPLPAPYYGVLVSLGGNTMDLVIGLEPLVAFMQEDVNGSFRFRVLERFTLRVKDTSGIVALKFN